MSHTTEQHSSTLLQAPAAPATVIVLVQHSGYLNSTLASVNRFIKAAVLQHHQIDHVFFYQDAIFSLLDHTDLAADEVKPLQELIKLAAAHQFPILYCATAAEQRGLGQDEHNPNAAALVPYAIKAGLAEFAMRCNKVDKVVQF
jgi:tRNA 2-thiouridine synthesizing protein D